ncbi:hypothetical protein EDB92DRAFT_1815064 [Lactarius akahatsu]|uniref:Uncharacterized protein n=1 Tax=Lactarius akahatsu TaxID=416441 RepID=A0AAD4LL35_9AGAM|nr:hypothetical protein EDB92DRAFT_1815064 [Lactarius akahatsu]
MSLGRVIAGHEIIVLGAFILMVHVGTIIPSSETTSFNPIAPGPVCDPTHGRKWVCKKNVVDLVAWYSVKIEEPVRRAYPAVKCHSHDPSWRTKTECVVVMDTAPSRSYSASWSLESGRLSRRGAVTACAIGMPDSASNSPLSCDISSNFHVQSDNAVIGSTTVAAAAMRSERRRESKTVEDSRRYFFCQQLPVQQDKGGFCFWKRLVAAGIYSKNLNGL